MGQHSKRTRRQWIFRLALGVVGAAAGLALSSSTASADLLGSGTTSTTTTICKTAPDPSGSSYAAVAHFMLCNLGSLTYTIYTEYKKPDGTIVPKSTTAVLGQTSYVNATGGTATSILGATTPDHLAPEISVTLRPEGADSLAALRFTTQVVGGPSLFPVSVEAVLTVPKELGLPRDNLSYGYDAKASTSPDSFVTVFSYGLTGQTTGDPVIGMGFDDHFPDQPSGALLGIGAHDQPTAYSLKLLGGIWTGTPQARVQPIAGATNFAPAPNAVTQVNVTLGTSNKTTTTNYSMQPHTTLLGFPAQFTPTVLTADFDAVHPTPESLPTDTIDVRATINKLPTSAQVAYTAADAKTTDVAYSAATAIDTLDTQINLNTNNNPTMATVHAEGVPTGARFHSGVNPGACSDGTVPNLEGKCTWVNPDGSEHDANFVRKDQPVTSFSTSGGSIAKLEANAAFSASDYTSYGVCPLPLLAPPVTQVGATDQGVAVASGVTAMSLTCANGSGLVPVNQSAVFARVLGLSKADYEGAVASVPAGDPSLSTNPQPFVPEIPMSLSVSHQAGPFDIAFGPVPADAPAATKVAVAIDDLPANFDTTFYVEAQKAHWHGDAKVASLTLDMATNAGNGSGAKSIHMGVQQLPTDIEMSFTAPPKAGATPPPPPLGCVTSSTAPPPMFHWAANDITPDVRVSTQGLGAPVNSVDVHIVGLPAKINFGMDDATGTGVLDAYSDRNCQSWDGPSSAITSLEMHAGEVGQSPWMLAPPLTASGSFAGNRIFSQSYIGGVGSGFQGQKLLRLDMYVTNVQTGWLTKTGTDPKVVSAHAAFGSGTAPLTTLVVIGKDGEMYGTPGFLKYGTPQFLGSEITAWHPPAKLDLDLSTEPPLSSAGVSLTSLRDATQVHYKAFAACQTGWCPAPIPGPITARLTSVEHNIYGINGYSFSDPTSDVFMPTSGYKVKAVNLTVDQLPQEATVCIGSGAGCSPILPEQGSTDSYSFLKPSDPIVHVATVGAPVDHPLILTSLTSCSALAPDAVFLAQGPCDSGLWPADDPSQGNRIDRVELKDIRLRNASFELGTGKIYSADDTGSAMTNSVMPDPAAVRLYADTAGDWIHVGSVHAVHWSTLNPFDESDDGVLTFDFTGDLNAAARTWAAVVDLPSIYVANPSGGSLQCRGVAARLDKSGLTPVIHVYSDDVWSQHPSTGISIDATTGQVYGGVLVGASTPIGADALKMCNG